MLLSLYHSDQGVMNLACLLLARPKGDKIKCLTHHNNCLEMAYFSHHEWQNRLLKWTVKWSSNIHFLKMQQRELLLRAVLRSEQQTEQVTWSVRTLYSYSPSRRWHRSNMPPCIFELGSSSCSNNHRTSNLRSSHLGMWTDRQIIRRRHRLSLIAVEDKLIAGAQRSLETSRALVWTSGDQHLGGVRE